MRRRDFIKVIAGSATVWPLVGRAQQGQPMRRIGVLMNLAADDKEGQVRLIAFVQALSDLGWNASNVRIDTCWGAGDPNRCARRYPSGLSFYDGPIAQPDKQHTRLCSHRCLTESVPAMSKASHVRAVT
jgi:hypothetical protein